MYRSDDSEPRQKIVAMYRSDNSKWTGMKAKSWRIYAATSKGIMDGVWWTSGVRAGEGSHQEIWVGAGRGFERGK